MFIHFLTSLELWSSINMNFGRWLSHCEIQIVHSAVTRLILVEKVNEKNQHSYPRSFKYLTFLLRCNYPYPVGCCAYFELNEECVTTASVIFPTDTCVCAHLHLFRRLSLVEVMLPLWNAFLRESNQASALMCFAYAVIRISALLLTPQHMIWKNVNFCNKIFQCQEFKEIYSMPSHSMNWYAWIL